MRSRSRAIRLLTLQTRGRASRRDRVALESTVSHSCKVSYRHDTAGSWPELAARRIDIPVHFMTGFHFLVELVRPPGGRNVRRGGTWQGGWS